jgi:hypothetical protein
MPRSRSSMIVNTPAPCAWLKSNLDNVENIDDYDDDDYDNWSSFNVTYPDDQVVLRKTTVEDRTIAIHLKPDGTWCIFEEFDEVTPEIPSPPQPRLSRTPRQDQYRSPILEEIQLPFTRSALTRP